MGVIFGAWSRNFRKFLTFLHLVRQPNPTSVSFSALREGNHSLSNKKRRRASLWFLKNRILKAAIFPHHPKSAVSLIFLSGRNRRIRHQRSRWSCTALGKSEMQAAHELRQALTCAAILLQQTHPLQNQGKLDYSIIDTHKTTKIL